jgi:hypothetical protein
MSCDLLGFDRLNLDGCRLCLDRFGFASLAFAAPIAQNLGEFSDEQSDDDRIVNLTNEGNKVRRNIQGTDQINQGSSNHPPAIFWVGNEIAIPVVERFKGEGAHGFLGLCPRGGVFCVQSYLRKNALEFRGFPRRLTPRIPVQETSLTPGGRSSRVRSQLKRSQRPQG